MPTKNTIDDASHQEWSKAGQMPTEQQRRDWYAKSAKIEGDACVGAGLPSGIAPCKPQAPSARSLWPDGSLPVVEAEALERKWSEDVQWWRDRAKSQIEKGHPLLAELSSQSADVLSGCAAQLGRLIAQSKSRQPEENKEV